MRRERGIGARNRLGGWVTADGVDPQSVRPPRGGMPTVAEWEERNRELARADETLPGFRLICRTRGCHEALGWVRLGADGPRLTIRAPRHSGDAAGVADSLLIGRFEFTAPMAPKFDAMHYTLRGRPRGSRAEFVCRQGHESAFSLADMLTRLRSAVLKSP